MPAQKEAFAPSEYYNIKEIKHARDFSKAVTHLIKRALAHEQVVRPANFFDRFLQRRLGIDPEIGVVANDFAQYDSSTDTGFANFDAGTFVVEEVPEHLKSHLLFISSNQPECMKIKATKLEKYNTTIPTIAIYKGEDYFAVQRKGDIISIFQCLPEEEQGETPLFLRNERLRLEFAEQVLNFANETLQVFMEQTVQR